MKSYSILAKVALLVLTSAAPYSRAEDLLLFGGDNNKEFLGCLNCSEYHSNSVWNDYSS